MAQQSEPREKPGQDTGDPGTTGCIRPKLIEEALVARVERAGRITYVLSDQHPERATYFGLNDLARSVVELCDGAHGLDEICRAVRERHGVDCRRGQVLALVEFLGTNGLLAGSAPAPPPLRAGERLAVGRVLRQITQFWVSFRADPLLSRLDPLASALARPACVWAILFWDLAGLALAVVWERRDLMAVLAGLQHASGIALGAVIAGAYLGRLLIAFCHELAHGMACRCFGGSGIRIGAGMYFFNPVFVCDTSAAWLIRKKRHRVLVSLAGPLCHMAFGAFGACLLLLPVPPPVATAAAILVTLGYGENLLTDFNPLLKYDGYYILADLLEMPNLRARSFACLRSLFYGGRSEAVSSKERILCLVYGILALLYTGFVIVCATGILILLVSRGSVGQAVLALLGPVLVFLSLLTRNGKKAGRGR